MCLFLCVRVCVRLHVRMGMLMCLSLCVLPCLCLSACMCVRGHVCATCVWCLDENTAPGGRQQTFAAASVARQLVAGGTDAAVASRCVDAGVVTDPSRLPVMEHLTLINI